MELAFKVGTMIELPARGDDRRRDRGGGRVLLLRHQRPHPDDVGVLPRRRGGGVLLAVPREGHLRGQPLRVPGPDGRGRAGERGGRAAAGPRDRTCTSGSAASTAATRTRSTSSSPPGSTTSPARPSGCRWRGWRRAAPWPTSRRTAATERTRPAGRPRRAGGPGMMSRCASDSTSPTTGAPSTAGPGSRACAPSRATSRPPWPRCCAATPTRSRVDLRGPHRHRGARPGPGGAPRHRPPTSWPRPPGRTDAPPVEALVRRLNGLLADDVVVRVRSRRRRRLRRPLRGAVAALRLPGRRPARAGRPADPRATSWPGRGPSTWRR